MKKKKKKNEKKRIYVFNIGFSAFSHFTWCHLAQVKEFLFETKATNLLHTYLYTVHYELFSVITMFCYILNMIF